MKTILTPEQRKESYVWAKSIVKDKWTQKKNYQLGTISSAPPLYPLVCKILADIWSMYRKNYDDLGDQFSYNTADQFPEFFKTRPTGMELVWWPMNEQGIEDRMNALDAAISEVNQLIKQSAPKQN